MGNIKNISTMDNNCVGDHPRASLLCYALDRSHIATISKEYSEGSIVGRRVMGEIGKGGADMIKK